MPECGSQEIGVLSDFRLFVDVNNHSVAGRCDDEVQDLAFLDRPLVCSFPLLMNVIAPLEVDPGSGGTRCDQVRLVIVKAVDTHIC
jgi:hypothetical protein